MLEEPLQAAAGRGDQHAPPRCGGDVAEGNAAGRDHAHNEDAEAVEAALAEVEMAS